MLKVLLVDDEQKEISFLLQSVSWAQMGLEVVGVAENGKLADEMEQQLCPDIVISDVVMPFQTGIELAARIRQRRKNVHIIFLTGHRSFEFAQEAIKSDVEYYLLKPVDPEQLRQVLAEVAQRCVDNKRKRFEQQLFQDMLRENMPALREMMLRQLLTGVVPEEQQRLQFYNISLQDGPVAAVVFQPAQALSDSEYERTLKNYRFAQAVQEILGKDSDHLFFSLETEGRYCLLASGIARQQTLFDLLQRLQQNVDLMCRQSVRIGVGKTVYTMGDIPQSYQTALLALEHCSSDSGNEILFFGDLLPEQTALPPVRLEDIKARLSESVVAGQTDKVRLTLEQLTRDLQTPALTAQVLHTVCIDLTNAVIWKVSTYYPMVIPALFGGEVSFLPLMELTDPENMVRWISGVLIPICENIAERQLSRQGQLAAELKNYMDNNLEKDMTVESIACVAGLSRGYASSIFKKQYGISINQYLLNARMTKAKELLAQPLLKIRDIAAMVGFYNNAHFSAVFKREVGIPPRDYREQRLEENK